MRIERLHVERDQLRAENQRLLDWIMGGEEPDALACLRRTYLDSRTTEGIRVRAASAAIAYERSLPAQVTVQVDLRQRVYDARMRANAELKALPAIAETVLESADGA